MEEMEEDDFHFVPLDTEVTQSGTEAELAPGPSGPNHNQPIRRKWCAGLKWYVMELVVPVLYPEALEGNVEDYLEAMVDLVVEEASEESLNKNEAEEEEIADSSEDDTGGSDIDPDAWEALEAGEDNDAALEALERIAKREPREVYSFDLSLMT